jgi:purine nucleoside phosphorylase
MLQWGGADDWVGMSTVCEAMVARAQTGIARRGVSCYHEPGRGPVEGPKLSHEEVMARQALDRDALLQAARSAVPHLAAVV